VRPLRPPVAVAVAVKRGLILSTLDLRSTHLDKAPAQQPTLAIRR
jgi:hypothetical protein